MLVVQFKTVSSTLPSFSFSLSLLLSYSLLPRFIRLRECVQKCDEVNFNVEKKTEEKIIHRLAFACEKKEVVIVRQRQ